MKKEGGFISEFKKFIMRGNVMDLAIGVIVGGSFAAIVTSLNEDILTPLLGIFGGVDLSRLIVTLGSGAHAPVLAYGSFLVAVINFLVTALMLFLLIRILNKITQRLSKKNKEMPSPAKEKACPYCKKEIAAEATRCPYCTSSVEAASANAPL